MNIQKLLLISGREYLTRVKKKSFIIITFLAPLGFALLMILPTVFMLMESDEQKKFLVKDSSGEVVQRLVTMHPEKYEDASEVSSETLRRQLTNKQIDGFLEVGNIYNGETPNLYYESIGFTQVKSTQSDVQSAIREAKLAKANVTEEVKSIMSSKVPINTRKLTEKGESEEDSGILFGLAYVLSFLIYFGLAIYGSIIMRGVLEEKSSRIVEVIVSSVKPFELLTGKVLGIGAVALTQFLLWAVLISGVSMVAGPVIGLMTQQKNKQTTEMISAMNIPDEAAAEINQQSELPFKLPAIPFHFWVFFILFFLIGFAMYGALFAAAGSAADSETDVQQFMLPLTLPLIIPIMLIGKIAGDPNSTFAISSSLFPLFSPILMVARMAATEVPLWQPLLSLLLCIGTFTGLMWASAKIYRVGILMYGKKPSYAELWKWLRY